MNIERTYTQNLYLFRAAAIVGTSSLLAALGLFLYLCQESREIANSNVQTNQTNYYDSLGQSKSTSVNLYEDLSPRKNLEWRGRHE